VARRGRGAATRPEAAPDGAEGATNGAEHPGARTMGAIAVQRWAARGLGKGSEGTDADDRPVTRGPFDEDDLDPEQTATELVDFGAVRIPVPRGGQVSVEPEEGRLQAVHVMLPAGRLSVSALAAPRTERLWPDLAAEIDESLREGGATVRSFTGEWGRELHARTGDASSVFLGVDGPRWMLYGVATGPTSTAEELDAALRRMLRGTVVVRGRLPYPVRTVLPLTVPEQLAEQAGAAERVPAARKGEPSNGRRGQPVNGRKPEPVAPANGQANPPGRGPGGRSGSPVSAGDDVATVPHGLPRVLPGETGDRPRAGGPRTNGVATGDGRSVETRRIPGVEGPSRPGGAGETAGLMNGARRRGSSAPADPPVTRTGQRRVAELLAEAGRERAERERAEQERVERERVERERAERERAERERAERERVERERVERERAERERAERERAERERAEAAARAAQAGTGHDDVALLRLGGAPRPPDADVRRSDSPFETGWSVSGPDTVRAPAPQWGPSSSGIGSSAGAEVAGSDDWTVPIPVVRPEPERGAEPPPGRGRPEADLWAGDPWADEARRAARVARSAEQQAREQVRHPAHGRGAHERGGQEAEIPHRGHGRGAHAHEAQEGGTHERPAHRRGSHERSAHRPSSEGPAASVDLPATRVVPPAPAAPRLADHPAAGRHRRPEE
jgi:Protein of unknown function (DUF3710)